MSVKKGLIASDPEYPEKAGDNIFRMVFEKIQTGILIIEPESHTIVDANPIAEFLIGLPKDQLLGRICHDFVCPAKCGECPITDLHKDLHNIERVLINAKGERIPILKTVAKATLGGRGYLIESFIDIVDRKRSEDRRLALILYMNEAVVRVQKPLGLTVQNLQTIADEVKKGDYPPEEIRMQLQIQINNLERMNRTLQELGEKSAAERTEIPEEFKQFFIGK